MCLCLAKSLLKTCLWCVGCTILILGAIILGLYFALRPKEPRFQVVDVQRAGDSPSLLNVSSEGMVLPYVNFILESHNPNKVEIEYNANYTLKVFSGENVTGQIGEAFLPPFSQGKKSVKNVTAGWLTPKALDESLLSVIREGIQNDLVHVTLTGTLQTKAVYVGQRSPRIKVELRCKVGFRPISNVLDSESTNCGVSVPVDQS